METRVNLEVEFRLRQRKNLKTIKRKTLEWQLAILSIIMVIRVMAQIMHVYEVVKTYFMIFFPVINVMNNQQRQL